jgi:hypothetical protein
MKKLNPNKFYEKIGITPHDAQKRVIDAYLNPEVRDIVFAGGARLGKSIGCAMIALMELLHDNRRIWLVAPDYNLAGKVFNHIEMMIATGFPDSEFKVSRRIPQHIDTKWGSWLECKSAENPTSLLGEELDLIIMDECSRIPEEVWESYLRQRLTTRQGKSVKISTPRGQNWFWRNWKQAKDNSDARAFQFATNVNPTFPKAEWEREKARTPEKIFQQEFEASFLPGSAGIFTNVNQCIKGELEEPNEKHLYTMGVDLGRYEDYTVIVVIDRMTNHVVHFNRFNTVDWSIQKSIIKETADKYNSPYIFMDATTITVGDAYVNELADEGYNVYGYKISGNLSKRQLVEKGVVMVNQGQITFPQVDDLIDEINAFTYNITEGGIIRYEAPHGMHDDAVIALCLACWDLDSQPLEEIENNLSGFVPLRSTQY